MYKQFSILFSVCLIAIVCFCGCSTTMTISSTHFEEVFGQPHIKQGDTYYYLQYFQPGSTVMILTFKENKLERYETKYIVETDFQEYVPMLIEMLRFGKDNRSIPAHKWLYSAMYVCFPDGYGKYYMHQTLHPYTGTPFKDEKLDNTTYKKWKEWWETEAKDLYIFRQEPKKN